MILRRMFSDAVGYSREGGNMIHFRILYKKVQQGYLRAFAGHILQTRHESINVSFAAAHLRPSPLSAQTVSVHQSVLWP